jgi:hypothetical protein
MYLESVWSRLPDKGRKAFLCTLRGALDAGEFGAQVNVLLALLRDKGGALAQASEATGPEELIAELEAEGLLYPDYGAYSRYSAAAASGSAAGGTGTGGAAL